MKIEIVRLGEKYALRRRTWLIPAKYKDLRCEKFWWPRHSQYFPDCLGSLESVERSADKVKYRFVREEVIKQILP